MLDWRFLTTIPDFLGQSACRFQGDLYLGGSWGLTGGLFDRAAYAPLVRVSPRGDLSAAWPWSVGATYSRGSGEGDAVTALAVWRGDLFASGARIVAGGVGAGNARIARFDGDEWTTEDTRQAYELVGGQDHLFLSWQGALVAWDGESVETIGGVSGGHPESLTPWQGQLAYLANRPIGGGPVLYLVSREGGQWRTQEGPHPVSARNGLSAGAGWYSGDFRLATFWGGLWSCEWVTDADGDNAYYLSSFTGQGWQRWLQIIRGQPFTLANLRSRLYLYEGSEDLLTDASSSNPFDGTWYQGLFDGTQLEGLGDAEVVPYRVIGFGDGSAVALCRTQARLDYVRELLLAGAFVNPDIWEPDGDTLVYVTWPTQPGPTRVPAGDLAGTVTDDTPAVLEGAEVATGDLSDLTDAAGDYGIGDLVVGRHTVGAALDGYLPESAEVAIAADAATDQDFALADLTAGKAALWGFVRDGVTGAGLYGATVTAIVGEVDVTATTGAGGFWQVELDPATYTVTATCPGYEDGAAQAMILAAGDVARVDFYLFADDGGAVAGFVRAIADGSPLGGAVVSLVRGAVTYQAVSDAGGYYSRVGLPAGEYAATVTLTGYQTRTGTVVVVAGRVTRADWSLVADAVSVGALQVTVTDADTTDGIVDAQVTVLGVGTWLTDAAGQVIIGGLPTDTYLLLVEAEGYYPAGASGAVTAPNTTAVAVALDPVAADEQSAWLFGFVREAADGDPIATATVTLAGDAHPENAGASATNAAGFYLRTGLFAGVESGTVAKTGFETRALANVPLSAGQGTRLDVALVATGGTVGVLQGYVVDAQNSSAIAQAQVWLDAFQNVYSGEAGQYRFPQVLVGAHELEAFAEGFYPGHVGGVPVAGGVTTECDLALFRIARLGTCVVTVQDETGALVEGATAALNPWISGTTGADGTATLESVPEGIYEAVAAKDGYLPGHATVQVPAGGTGTVTVTITAQAPGDDDGVLAGYVCDQYTRRGIVGATVQAAGTVTEMATSEAGGYYALALDPDTYDATGSADDYRSRVYPDVAVVTQEVTWLDVFLLPGGETAGVYFVGVPPTCASELEETGVPFGGAGAVCVDWPEDDASWEVAVAVDEQATSAAGLFRRGQRVARGAREALAKQGSEVRIVTRRTSGTKGGVAAQFWPV